MKVVVLHSGIPFPNGADYMAESCARAFRLLGHEVYELGGYHRGKVKEIFKVLDLVDEVKPALVLHLYGLYLPVEIVDRINQKGIPTVLWVQNEEKEFNLTMGISSRYSLFCTYTTLTLDRHRELGANVMYLPIAADHTVYYPLDPPLEKDIDVAWIGAPHRRRVQIAERLKKAFPRSFFDFSLSLPAEKVNEIYNRTKVVVGIYQDCDEPVSAITRRRCTLNTERAWGCPCRTFEVPAARAFQLQSPREDLPSVYSPEEVALAEEEEIEDKVAYYLKEEGERERIAEAAYRRTIREHLYIHRMRQILERLTQDGLLDEKKALNGPFDKPDPRLHVSPSSRSEVGELKRVFYRLRPRVREKRVLHLGCGGGLGSELLAKKANLVVAVEEDPLLLCYARVNHPRPNLIFVDPSTLKEQFGHNFDATCFVTLNADKDISSFIEQSRRFLKPGGEIFLGGRVAERKGFKVIWQKGDLRLMKGKA